MNLGRIRRALAMMVAAAAAAWVSPASAQQQAAQTGRQLMVMVAHPADHIRPGTGYAGGYGDDLARSARERLARRIARQFGLTLVDDWPMAMIGVDCFIMAVPGDRSLKQAADELARDSRIAWTQPVEVYTAQASPPPVPNDPLFAAQPAARQWQLAKLQRLATGSGVRVAVVDSGIDAAHPDLKGQIAVNRNFVAGRPMAAEQHGTGVAGIIAARAGNGIGLAGVAPGAKLLGLRACWQATGKTQCDSFSLAKALYFAIDQKAAIINLSLSGPDDRLLRTLLKTAMAKGETVVAAFDRTQANGGFPASVPGVIAVTDASLAPPRSHVYIAPGRDVPTTQPGGRWFLVNGSSFSAAHVSGLFALLRQRSASISPSLVAQGGYVDACATMAYAGLDCDCACGGRAPRAALRR
ncbi:MAG TPA: S8 family serine peptidase [Sphingomicrobium sp.]|nr:S8 family serine peptidase [Sphingomicrobium sp.]